MLVLVGQDRVAGIDGVVCQALPLRRYCRSKSIDGSMKQNDLQLANSRVGHSLEDWEVNLLKMRKRSF
jgi:hypothetical protein